MRDTTRKLADGIEAIDGLRLMRYPQTTLFSFTSDEVRVFTVADLMKKRGYYIQPQLGFGGHRENLHISVNPANCGGEDEFLAALAESVEEARAQQTTSLEPLLAQLSALEGELPFAKVLEMIGMQGVDLPEETATINEVLNVLPRPLSEKLLIEFFNELFVPVR